MIFSRRGFKAYVKYIEDHCRICESGEDPDQVKFQLMAFEDEG